MARDQGVQAPPARQAGRKTHQVLADHLRQQILSGELAKGDRLPIEEDLTAQFGVARTTLREALRVLESQGLIAIRRGRGGGPVVTHPDLAPIALAFATSLQLQGATVGDLDEARQLFEPQIVRRLAAQGERAGLTELEGAIAVAHDAAEAADAHRFGLAAANVHEALVGSSGNLTLSTMTKMLHHLVRAYYTRNADRFDQAHMRRAVRGYRKLVNLIRSGDGEAAADHWQATMRYTIAAHDRHELVTALLTD